MRQRGMCEEALIAAMRQSIEENPNEPNRQQAQPLELWQSILWKILRKNLSARIETEQLSSASHVRRVGPSRYGQRSRHSKESFVRP